MFWAGVWPVTECCCLCLGTRGAWVITTLGGVPGICRMETRTTQTSAQARLHPQTFSSPERRHKPSSPCLPQTSFLSMGSPGGRFQLLESFSTRTQSLLFRAAASTLEAALRSFPALQTIGCLWEELKESRGTRYKAGTTATGSGAPESSFMLSAP